jgi:hypothetical protein
MQIRRAELVFGERPSRTRETLCSRHSPALAQTPPAESDQAAPSAQPVKPKMAAHKQHKKHAAKKAKAKTETEKPDNEKKGGDTQQ